MNLFKDKHILVTGGSGMVGRELVQLLLERGAKIRVVSLDEPIDFFDEVEFIKVTEHYLNRYKEIKSE